MRRRVAHFPGASFAAACPPTPPRLPQPYTLTLPADLAEKDKSVDFPDYKLEGPVMVTGGAGFLGSHIVDALRRQPNNLRIVVFDLADYKPPSNSNVVYEKGDLTKAETIAAAIAKHGVRLVIHVSTLLRLAMMMAMMMGHSSWAGCWRVPRAAARCKPPVLSLACLVA